MNSFLDYSGVGSLYGKVQQALICSVLPGCKQIVTVLLECTQRMSRGPVFLV